MTFAKQAADLLASDEAEEDRGKTRSHWKDYLATGLGLAGLGAAGYYGHKYWPQISKGINNAVNGDPNADLPPGASIMDHATHWLTRPMQPGGLDRVLGDAKTTNTGASILTGGALGATAGATSGLRGASLAQLRDISSGAKPGSEAAVGVAKFDTDLGREGALATHANSVLNPISAANKAHPFNQAYKLKTGKEYPSSEGMLNKIRAAIAGPTRLGKIQKGLRIAASLASQTVPPLELPNDPGAAATPSPPAGMRARVQAAQEIQENSNRLLRMPAEEAAARLGSLQRMSRTTMPLLRRSIYGGLGGALAGAVGHQVGGL